MNDFTSTFAIGRSGLCSTGPAIFSWGEKIGTSIRNRPFRPLLNEKAPPWRGAFSLEPQTYAPDLKNQVGAFSDANIRNS
jgi:hypothetical protein